MQLRKLLRFLPAALLLLALVLVGPRESNAFVNGYNLIRILACSGGQTSSGDYLVIYDQTTGGVLVTYDPITIMAGASFCANGNAFYAIFTDGIWNGVVLYPGFK